MSQSSIYINQAHRRSNKQNFTLSNEFEESKKIKTKNSNDFKRFQWERKNQQQRIQRKINEYIKTGCFIFDVSSGKHRIEYQSIYVCIRSLTGSSFCSSVFFLFPKTKNYISPSQKRTIEKEEGGKNNRWPKRNNLITKNIRNLFYVRND